MPESGIIITATYCRLQVGVSGVIMLMESIINLLGGTLLTVMILCYCCYVNFGYSGKATKFEKIFHLNLTLLSSVKFKVEDFFKFCGLLRIS